MEDVETRFKFALQYIDKGGVAAQHAGQPAPSNEVLLEYYASAFPHSPSPSPAHSCSCIRLYKQANHGDCSQPQPWKVQVERFYKWCSCRTTPCAALSITRACRQAWSSQRGMSKAAAMQEYVDRLT